MYGTMATGPDLMETGIGKAALGNPEIIDGIGDRVTGIKDPI